MSDEAPVGAVAEERPPTAQVMTEAPADPAAAETAGIQSPEEAKFSDPAAAAPARDPHAVTPLPQGTWDKASGIALCLTRVCTRQGIAILGVLGHEGPQSLGHLTERLGAGGPGVREAATALADAGLVHLIDGPRFAFTAAGSAFFFFMLRMGF